MTSIATTELAFRHCEQLARAHYENFPVASFFLPKRLRPYVAAIYAFARTADDFADEGNLQQEERLNALDDWQAKLDACYAGNADHPIFIALAEVAQTKNIPKQLLSDLLIAFRMDVTTKRYRTYSDLLYYCRHSANPVGRLVLHLIDDASERNLEHSDHICTALQLTNFWQDISSDWARGRLYVPLEDVARFGYTELDLGQSIVDARFRKLLKFEVDRTKELFERGKPLLREATSPLRFELLLTWNGGMTILQKIEEANYNVLAYRPSISLFDKLLVLMKSVLHKTV